MRQPINNPFEGIAGQTEATAAAATPKTTAPKTTNDQAATVARESVNFRLRPDLAERLRNAAYWLRLTANGIGEDALHAYLSALESEHNGGQPFEQRDKELTTGKRAKK